ncbi:MAG: hypothetical protein CVU69_09995 [Deltaproteobacteria bacterium HGW-Deltaproteobacteria-4]|nr:MAG: hypothetical protein CVU69_09995 [Deltaproteobacteria bacterium HGW-Deltaproteobacteria-4]
MKSKRFLGFLIAAFIAALIYGYLQMPKQERVTTSDEKSFQQPQAKKQQPGKKTTPPGEKNFPRLRTDLLERKSQPYPGVRRNLFSADIVGSQLEEEIEIIIEKPPAVIVPPVFVAPPPPPPRQPSPQEIAQKELARYKFVGFFKKGEKKTIFLSVDGEILLVRKGEYLGRDRKYYVVNITDTTLELRKDGVGDFSIKLIDQEPFSAIPFQSGPSISPSNSWQEPPEAAPESYQQDQTESLPIPDDVLPTEDQIQPEEDN